jgi:hypothetical protein
VILHSRLHRWRTGIAIFVNRAAWLSIPELEMPMRPAACAEAAAKSLARGLPLLNVTPFSNKGHIMTKASSLLIAGAAALLPLAAAIAQTPEPTQPTPSESQGKGTSFESLDTDGDGRISKTEAEANANVKAQFATYDINGDGFIERAEVSQANSQSEPPKQ